MQPQNSTEKEVPMEVEPPTQQVSEEQDPLSLPQQAVSSLPVPPLPMIPPHSDGTRAEDPTGMQGEPPASPRLLFDDLLDEMKDLIVSFSDLQTAVSLRQTNTELSAFAEPLLTSAVRCFACSTPLFMPVQQQRQREDQTREGGEEGEGGQKHQQQSKTKTSTEERKQRERLSLKLPDGHAVALEASAVEGSGLRRGPSRPAQWSERNRLLQLIREQHREAREREREKEGKTGRKEEEGEGKQTSEWRLSDTVRVEDLSCRGCARLVGLNFSHVGARLVRRSPQRRGPPHPLGLPGDPLSILNHLVMRGPVLSPVPSSPSERGGNSTRPPPLPFGMRRGPDPRYILEPVGTIEEFEELTWRTPGNGVLLERSTLPDPLFRFNPTAAGPANRQTRDTTRRDGSDSSEPPSLVDSQSAEESSSSEDEEGGPDRLENPPPPPPDNNSFPPSIGDPPTAEKVQAKGTPTVPLQEEHPGVESQQNAPRASTDPPPPPPSALPSVSRPCPHPPRTGPLMQPQGDVLAVEEEPESSEEEKGGEGENQREAKRQRRAFNALVRGERVPQPVRRPTPPQRDHQDPRPSPSANDENDEEDDQSDDEQMPPLKSPSSGEEEEEDSDRHYMAPLSMGGGESDDQMPSLHGSDEEDPPSLVSSQSADGGDTEDEDHEDIDDTEEDEDMPGLSPSDPSSTDSSGRRSGNARSLGEQGETGGAHQPLATQPSVYIVRQYLHPQTLPSPDPHSHSSESIRMTPGVQLERKSAGRKLICCGPASRVRRAAREPGVDRDPNIVLIGFRDGSDTHFSDPTPVFRFPISGPRDVTVTTTATFAPAAPPTSSSASASSSSSSSASASASSSSSSSSAFAPEPSSSSSSGAPDAPASASSAAPPAERERGVEGGNGNAPAMQKPPTEERESGADGDEKKKRGREEDQEMEKEKKEKENECGQVLSTTRAVLSRQHRWDAGRGNERAWYLNHFEDGAVRMDNRRAQRLNQGRMHVEDVFCSKCNLQIGWKFAKDAERTRTDNAWQ
eukprot:Cvel_19164.t1-p1 / transcript=Cvel_19164.t1 / gene=Cvel_19164 / organism=Chromera_velia_CCMP2878 / gene_product=hypothetical protein / transcript_product=hypothetical protein / location=Cvel_scaffold1632:37038-42287(+) / protein_length=1021 / sequence_SO=supercontig / SO=protein_coding / is_pseudo=false